SVCGGLFRLPRTRGYQPAHHCEGRQKDGGEVSIPETVEGDGAEHIGPERKSKRRNHRVGDPGVSLLAHVPHDYVAGVSARPPFVSDRCQNTAKPLNLWVLYLSYCFPSFPSVCT